MGAFLLLFVTFVITAAVQSTQLDGGEHQDSDAEQQAVRAVLEGQVAASGDAQAYVSFLTEDAVMMYSGQPAVVGTDAIHAFVSEFFEEYHFEFAPWQSDEIQISGNWAFHRFSGILTLMPKGGGETIYLDRKYIDILRKENDSWKISHHIYNTNK